MKMFFSSKDFVAATPNHALRRSQAAESKELATDEPSLFPTLHGTEATEANVVMNEACLERLYPDETWPTNEKEVTVQQLAKYTWARGNFHGKSAAVDSVNRMKENVKGISTRVVFYNASGQDLYLFTHVDLNGQGLDGHIPLDTLRNGETMSYLHVKSSVTTRSSEAAFIYETQDGANACLVGFETKSKELNVVYTDVGSKSNVHGDRHMLNMQGRQIYPETGADDALRDRIENEGRKGSHSCRGKNLFIQAEIVMDSTTSSSPLIYVFIGDIATKWNKYLQ
mmetsp:Transcript_22697/g.41029  ORF Transcript_22697/g.41029 Transcript_22697/m.41029 type:complete len:283 (-) Transcript_22697:222-1070(-)